MAHNRPSRRSPSKSFSNLLGRRRPSEPLRRAPRRRDVERLEERQMLAAEGVGIGFTNDPLAGDQWHLLADGQLVSQPNAPEYNQTIALTEEDINVLNAWAQNVSGKNIQIAILAGGFDLNHEDLGNFVTELGYDFVGNDIDPSYEDPNDYEGTALAGLIGATANNNLGGVGVAYDADLIPIRIDIAGDDSAVLTTEDYVQALTYLAGFANDLDNDGVIDPISQDQTVEIYLHAWDDGSQSDSREAIRIDPAISNALRTSVSLGRPYWDDANDNGVLDEEEADSYRALGSVHIVPTGNFNGPGTDAAFQDIGFLQSAAYNELANSRFTIAVGSVDHGGDYENLETGTVTGWSGISPATLIVAPAGSSGINGLEITAGVDGGSALWTTDITGEDGQNGPPVFGFEADGDFLTDTNYTSTFSDTSGAAAQVAGAVALMLEVNPDLTYREIQYILMASARQNDQFSETWVTNPYTHFSDDLQAPSWFKYDFDTDGEAGAEIENGVIPNFMTVTDPDTGIETPVALREFFNGSFGFGNTNGDPDFHIPFTREDFFPLPPDGPDGVPDGLVGTDGLFATAPDTEAMPPVPGVPLTTSSPIAPDEIFLFPEDFAEDLNDLKIGLFSLLRPASANAQELQFENGAGFTVSWGHGSYLEEIGYAHGVLDVTLAVEMARKWDEFGFQLPEEVTVTTGVQGGNASVIRIQPRAELDLGDGDGTFIIPGSINGGDINLSYWSEFLADFAAEEVELFDAAGETAVMAEILTDGPFMDPDRNSGIEYTRVSNVIPIPLEPGIVDDFMTTEWVEFRTIVEGGDVDNLRLTLVSPNGTHTELTPYRLPADLPSDSVFQVGQDYQGSIYPNATEIIDSSIGGGFNPIPDQIDGSEEQIISGIEVPEDAVSGGESWTWTTNRHWGELLSIEAQSEDGGLGEDQQWRVVVENWGSSAVSFGQYEVAFHGYESTGSRIQGKIGVDDNKQDIDDQDNDERFNFDRFLTFGQLIQDVDGDEEITSIDQTSSPRISVVLDDAFDSVALGNVYETRDPDTGEEFRYAVIDELDYFDLGSTDPTVVESARARIANRLIQAQAEQQLLPWGAVEADTLLGAARESHGFGDASGDPLTFQNFDFSQESFELGVTVVAEQIRIDHAPRTESGVAGATSTPVETGVTQKFLTGADGNYFFDVEATPEPPSPLNFDTEEAFNFAYDNWHNDYGGVTYQYRVTLENVADERRIDKSYTATPDQHGGYGGITYDSSSLGYEIEIFAAPNVQAGGTSVIRDANFLLKIDPADTNVEVAGSVYLDFDGDSVQDDFDTPIEGAVVFYDANMNGVLDLDPDGDPLTDDAEPSGLTGEDGTYTLTIVGLPNDQDVDILLDTSTIDPDLEPQNPSTASLTLSAEPGEGLAANFTLQPVGGVGGIINGSVFEDQNENGILDGTEGGIPEDRTVRVYVDLNSNGLYDADPDGNPLTDDAEPSTITGTDGAFTISSQTDGSFQVRVDLEGQPFRQTTPLGDAGIGVDVMAGQVVSGLVFGLFDQRTQDFGDLYVDATHNYPTLAEDDGARHRVQPGFYLGAGVDIDEDGVETTNALGDDLGDGNDDEDGVVLVSTEILPNSTITFDITATGSGASLNAWIDFNNDGDWNDPGEQIAIDAGLASGEVNRRSFPTPSDVDASADFLAARFRWGPFGLSYTGAANSGEVEDYMLPTSPQVTVTGRIATDANNNEQLDVADISAAGVIVYYDADSDGVRDINEPSALTNAAGGYSFTIDAAEAFNMTLRVDQSTLPGGVDFLSPPDGIFARAVSLGELVTADFLLAPLDQFPQGVSGQVFEDADNDGFRDPGEGGLTGVTVELYSGFGGGFTTLVGSDLTDIDGNYEIEAPGAGTYEVRLSLGGSTFLVQTLPGTGGREVVVNAGQSVAIGDFGVYDQSATFTDDYGDLFVGSGVNYPTLAADNGARHTVVPGVFLGSGVDRDSGLLTSTNALADDNTSTDDEDGVSLFSPQIVADSTIEIDVFATGVGATLDAWIDFNNDGDWDDAGERIATGLALTSGATTRIQAATPSDVDTTAAGLAARFRWGAGTVNYFGAATSGEVEDYFLPTSQAGGGQLAGDYTGNGVVDMADYDKWSDTYGSTTDLAADGNGDLIVDAADYTIWRDYYAIAQIQAAAAAAAAATAPQAAQPEATAEPIETSEPKVALASAPTVDPPTAEPPAVDPPSFPALVTMPITEVFVDPSASINIAAAVVMGPSLDESFAEPGETEEEAAASGDALDAALLELEAAGPVADEAAAPSGERVEEDESEEEEELALAVLDEVFAF